MSFWTKSAQFYAAVAVALGLAGEVIVLATILEFVGPWAQWSDWLNFILTFTAPAIAVAAAVVIGTRLPRVAIGICIASALCFAYLSFLSLYFVGLLAVIEASAIFATSLVAAAIGRDRELGPA